MPKDKEKKTAAQERDDVTEVPQDKTAADDTTSADNSQHKQKEPAHHTKSVKNDSKEIAALEEKLAEYSDQLLRLKAEYANYKKRTTLEKESAYGDGKCDLVKAILPVVDNFERALANTHGEKTSINKAFEEGMKLIYKQIIDVLDRENIEYICSVGEKFDPEFHNAVMHIEDDSMDAGVVVEEFQKGYKYKDKVIRHSMVKVAN